jgi:hypothetical protein
MPPWFTLVFGYAGSWVVNAVIQFIILGFVCQLCSVPSSVALIAKSWGFLE